MPSSLESQIKSVEDTIREKKGTLQDTSYEESLIKAWREYLPGGSKHHLGAELGRDLKIRGRQKPLSQNLGVFRTK